MSDKMIICVDFDGVIHSYEKGWQRGEIYGTVVPGFFEWAYEAQKHFKIVIYSSRSKTEEGRNAMRGWIQQKYGEWITTIGKHRLGDIPDYEFASEKPPAWITIDDRCIRFDGDWSDPKFSVNALQNFKPWTQFPKPDSVDGICECCNKNSAIGVGSTPFVPMSIAWCKDCLAANVIPYDILVHNTALIGGFDQSNDVWKDLIIRTLNYFKKPSKEFNDDVRKSMEGIENLQQRDNKDEQPKQNLPMFRDLGLTYEQAAHAVQSALTFAIETDPQNNPSTPKHMRVGIDLSKAEQAGFARLLIDKGIFTLAEYVEYMRLAVNEEVYRWQDYYKITFR